MARPVVECYSASRDTRAALDGGLSERGRRLIRKLANYADWGVVAQSMMATAGLFTRLTVAAVVAAGLTGCGLSSLTSGLGGGMFGGSSEKTAAKGVSEEQLLSAAKQDDGATASTGGELAHGCPRFTVWSRDNNLTIYEAGRVGDGLAIMHRGEITKTARECEIQSGRVTVKYGFSGRVLLGPRGKPGIISMPLNVFVTDGKRERVAADKMKVDVTVAPDKPIGYFSMVKTVSFTIPEGSRPGEYEVFVSFERNVPGAG